MRHYLRIFVFILALSNITAQESQTTLKVFDFESRGINNLSLNSNCSFNVTPDLSLLTSNSTIDREITTAINLFSDDYLGTSPPSSTELNDAINDYNSFNISVSGNTISGNQVSNFGSIPFLKTFAQHLKYNPLDSDIAEKANNTVWLVGQQFCNGNLSRDSNMYSYRGFAKAAILLQNFLNTISKELFKHTLYVHTSEFQHFWIPTFDKNYQKSNGAINTDLIYNLSHVLLAYTNWHDTADERYQYIRGFTRFMERFSSYTYGTTDGIKKDGSGFHHWTAYDGYMYALSAAAEIVYYLSYTSFSIHKDNYKILRNAIFSQFIISNENGYKALSMSGRNPHFRGATYNQYQIKKLAIAGGRILGLTTADPKLAGIYNRIWGVDSDFNYNSITPINNHKGFFQFNHASVGLLRKDNWLAVTKGFSNNMWGSEIYINRNRYGRYQSYGTLEIIYSGDMKTGNGFDINTWDWNYNPGATTIVLPWDKLHAEKGRIDELQQKRFVGSLSFNSKNESLLSKTHGTWGIFAMDFQEQEGLGWSTIFSSNNHNDSFTFKKSTFLFDDIIIALGSNINNNDNTNLTVTTLFQRRDNTSNPIIVNNVTENNSNTYDGFNNNWIISNYNTGYYLVSGNDNLILTSQTQQTPNYDQTNPNDYTGNTTAFYKLGYINHGVNPSNAKYEYMALPETNTTTMSALHSSIQGGNKPYTVHQQNATAHIIEHVANKTWGYAIFNNTAISNSGLVTAVNHSSLLMYQENNDGSIKMSLTNPDLGFESRQYNSSIDVDIEVTLSGNWQLQNSHPDITLITRNNTSTVLQFHTIDGLPIETVLLDQHLKISFDAILPSVFSIHQNYPNPFNPTTTLRFDLPEVSDITLIIYDILGQRVKTFNKKSTPAGYHSVTWNATNDLDQQVGAGVYLYQLQAKEFVKTRKMVLLK